MLLKVFNPATIAPKVMKAIEILAYLLYYWFFDKINDITNTKNIKVLLNCKYLKYLFLIILYYKNIYI